jgi:hypothetical protein
MLPLASMLIFLLILINKRMNNVKITHTVWWAPNTAVWTELVVGCYTTYGSFERYLDDVSWDSQFHVNKKWWSPLATSTTNNKTNPIRELNWESIDSISPSCPELFIVGEQSNLSQSQWRSQIDSKYIQWFNGNTPSHSSYISASQWFNPFYIGSNLASLLTVGDAFDNSNFPNNRKATVTCGQLVPPSQPLPQLKINDLTKSGICWIQNEN